MVFAPLSPPRRGGEHRENPGKPGKRSALQAGGVLHPRGFGGRFERKLGFCITEKQNLKDASSESLVFALLSPPRRGGEGGLDRRGFAPLSSESLVFAPLSRPPKRGGGRDPSQLFGLGFGVINIYRVSRLSSLTIDI